MYCNKCGAELKDDSKFCHQCGAIVKNDNSDEFIDSEELEDCHLDLDMCNSESCPGCGSKRLQAIVKSNNNVTTTGGGYSVGNGCLGYLLFGPFGLLCGNCGQSQKTTLTNDTKTYWICKQCGYEFRTKADLEKEQLENAERRKKSGKICLISGILIVILSFLLILIPGGAENIGIYNISIIMVIGFIAAIVGFAKSTMRDDEDDENDNGEL